MSERPEPIPYATASPRTRWTPWLIGLSLFTALLLGLFALNFSQYRSRYQRVRDGVRNIDALHFSYAVAVNAPRPVSFSITIRQRQTQVLPGSNDTFIHVGEIRSGQVNVTIEDINGRRLLDNVSMRQGDRAVFALPSMSVDLRLTRLHNQLVGDDYAVFELAASAWVLLEEVKIVRLIATLADAPPELQFIRNGKAYRGADAATHLKRKLAAAGDAKLTARQLIESLTSRSAESGEPYEVQQPDGRTLTVAEWLTVRLLEIEGAPATAPSSGR